MLFQRTQMRIWEHNSKKPQVCWRLSGRHWKRCLQRHRRLREMLTQHLLKSKKMPKRENRRQRRKPMNFQTMWKRNGKQKSKLHLRKEIVQCKSFSLTKEMSLLPTKQMSMLLMQTPHQLMLQRRLPETLTIKTERSWNLSKNWERDLSMKMQSWLKLLKLPLKQKLMQRKQSHWTRKSRLISCKKLLNLSNSNHLPIQQSNLLDKQKPLTEQKNSERDTESTWTFWNLKWMTPIKLLRNQVIKLNLRLLKRSTMRRKLRLMLSQNLLRRLKRKQLMPKRNLMRLSWRELSATMMPEHSMRKLLVSELSRMIWVNQTKKLSTVSCRN